MFQPGFSVWLYVDQIPGRIWKFIQIFYYLSFCCCDNGIIDVAAIAAAYVIIRKAQIATSPMAIIVPRILTVVVVMLFLVEKINGWILIQAEKFTSLKS